MYSPKRICCIHTSYQLAQTLSISCIECSFGVNYHFSSTFLRSAWGLEANLLLCHGLILACASAWLNMTSSSWKAIQPYYYYPLLKLTHSLLLDSVQANILLIEQDGFQTGIRINSAVTYCNKLISTAASTIWVFVVQDYILKHYYQV